jgi:hypothetical protein
VLVAIVYITGVILNFAWEMAQAPLYASMGTFWPATWRCFKASLGDGVVILAVWLLGATRFGSATWFLRRSVQRVAFAAGVGVSLAILVELWGLQTARWSYGSHMPLVPGTPIAIVPLAQMAVLVPLTFEFTRRIIATAHKAGCKRDAR